MGSASVHRASHDTVAGLLTPPGRGALAVVRVSGPAAPRLLADLSRSARRGTQSDGDAGRLRIARWSGTGGELVVVHPVDSRTIDVTCHGGPVAARIILRDLVSRGARGIDWGELARLEAASRVRGESVEALARATTLRSAAILLDQFHGALDRAVGAIASTLRSGEISSAPPSLARLLGRTSVGLHLAAPWRVAIVGRPNAGKSSLLNALVGYERAIVDAHEGTTRDLVTAETATDGWWLELWDSAGVRDGAGELEAAGIHRVRDALSASDLQLLVMDRSRPICEMDLALRAACPQPIVVATKADLPPAWGQLADGAPPFTVSARTGEGIVQLTAGLARFLVPRPPAPGDAVPFTVRQVELLETARSRVESGDPAGAVRALEDLVGSACV